ncbi:MULTISPECIES: hypothetical protein [unclassified Streptomyces]|uniref:hypothetical protein n=1 Tax=unclassified Streptomyces TaxID=2593676 RepID=UPI0036F6363C
MSLYVALAARSPGTASQTITALTALPDGYRTGLVRRHTQDWNQSNRGTVERSKPSATIQV